MSRIPHQTVAQHFASLLVSPAGNDKQHLLFDILVITISGFICGAHYWVENKLWGKDNRGWLKTVLQLPNGTPCNEAFGRAFARLDPIEFRRLFLNWIRAVSKLTQPQSWRWMATNCGVPGTEDASIRLLPTPKRRISSSPDASCPAAKPVAAASRSRLTESGTPCIASPSSKPKRNWQKKHCIALPVVLESFV